MTFFTFLVGYVLSQFYRSFLAVIAPELSAELGLSPADLGAASAAWFAAFALAQIPVGYALDHYGPRRALAWLAVFGSLGALIFAHAHNATGTILAMAFIGIGCSGALMGALFLFARTQPQRFAMLSSLIIGLGGIGNLLGATPLAYAAQTFGWRSVFYGLAAINAAQVLLVLRVLVEPPAASAPTTERGGVVQGLKDIIAVRTLWPLWPLMAVSYGILITERGLWVGPYLSDVFKLAPVPRGHVILLFALAISAGAFAYGPLENWLRRRKPLVLAGSLIAGAALATLALLPQPPLLVASALLCLFGFAGMTYGPLMAHVRIHLPDRLLGRGMTFANMLCMGGAGYLQAWSGTFVTRLKGQASSPQDLFAALHLTLAAILIAGAVIYAFTREADKPATPDAANAPPP